MRKIIYICLCSVALVGCSNNENVLEPGNVEMRILPQVENTSPAYTRTIITGTQFPSGSSVGLAIYNKSTTNPHRTGYDRIKAIYSGTNWAYYVNGSNTSTLLQGYNNTNLDVVGYYPYNDLVTDVAKVPFRIGNTEATNEDYMWAYQPNQAMGTIPLTFNHLMTCLEFRIRKLYAGPKLTIKSIVYSIAGRKFVVAGTYDAKNGKISPTMTEDKFGVVFDKTIKQSIDYPNLNTEVASCAVMMPELIVSDGGDATVSVTIDFDNETLHNNGGTYTFKLTEVVDSSGAKGLLAGKKYTVGVDVSNFVKYTGFPVCVDWLEDADETVTIPIEVE